jgi:hypothetical protein
MRVRQNAMGNSFPWIRVVIGGGAALFGAYGLWFEYDRWTAYHSFKTDDLGAAAAIFVVGLAVMLWGAWRVKHPARWIELDTEQRTLTLGGGGPPRTVPFDQVGTLEVKTARVLVGRKYRSYPCVYASGLPDAPLYAGLGDAKAHARKAELEALLAGRTT